MDVGAELRHAREQRGLSVDELARRTKITPAALRAIENNDVDRLPGGIFTRGFLRAYAHEVGLDPATLTARYLAQFEPPPETQTSAGDSPDGSTSPPLPPHPPQPRRIFLRAPRFPTVQPRALRGMASLVVVAALGFAVVRWHGAVPPRNPDARSSVAAAAGGRPPDGRSTSGGATGMTGQSHPAVATVATSGTVLRVALQARGECWISATADGKRATYRLMRADERETIEAQNEMVLRVGEPANLRWSINGAAGKIVGRPGTPTTIRITRQNYTGFLER